jgi:hypothetical protein
MPLRGSNRGRDGRGRGIGALRIRDLSTGLIIILPPKAEQLILNEDNPYKITPGQRAEYLNTESVLIGNEQLACIKRILLSVWYEGEGRHGDKT